MNVYVVSPQISKRGVGFRDYYEYLLLLFVIIILLLFNWASRKSKRKQDLEIGACLVMTH